MYFERFWFRLSAVHALSTFKYAPYEKQMKGSKHLYTPDSTAISVFTVFLASRFDDLTLMSRTSPLSFSGEFDGVILV